MQAVARSYSTFSMVVAIAFDRVMIPLAVVVGLAGGAMIGAELARLQTPAIPFIN
ncbi:MAG: hypothetical protein ACKVPY_15185 [Paracoccaceae bacterium]